MHLSCEQSLEYGWKSVRNEAKSICGRFGHKIVLFKMSIFQSYYMRAPHGEGRNKTWDLLFNGLTLSTHSQSDPVQYLERLELLSCIGLLPTAELDTTVFILPDKNEIKGIAAIISQSSHVADFNKTLYSFNSFKLKVQNFSGNGLLNQLSS